MILHIMQAKTLCEISQYPFPGFYKLVEVNENADSTLKCNG